jgi:hypothetical protein
MPLTEKEAQTLVSSGQWKDAEIRNKTIRKWAEFAREKYGEPPATSQYLRNAPGLIALALGIAMVIGLFRRRNLSRRTVNSREL